MVLFCIKQFIQYFHNLGSNTVYDEAILSLNIPFYDHGHWLALSFDLEVIIESTYNRGLKRCLWILPKS